MTFKFIRDSIKVTIRKTILYSILYVSIFWVVIFGVVAIAREVHLNRKYKELEKDLKKEQRRGDRLVRHQEAIVETTLKMINENTILYIMYMGQYKTDSLKHIKK